jgi:hypothetical protein
VGPSAETTESGVSRRAAAVGLGITFLVSVGACVKLVADHVQIGPQRLSPISISLDACPYLGAVHAVSVKLNDQWAHALDGTVTWPMFRSELVEELPVLEGALSRAESHVPERIASRLETVVLDVHLGRAELAHATSVADVVFPGGGTRVAPVFDGVTALSEASDLVGSVCGWRLAPSNALTP